LEIRNLETFVQIANLGSFTRAADALSLTQPATTRQIAALEAELHTRLLDRLCRRVELTDAGKVLFGYASDIVRLTEEAAKAVTEIAEGLSGRIALGASSTTATYLLPPLLRQYHDAHPAIDVSVRTGPSRRIAEMVADNTVDLGIVMESRDIAGLRVVKLAGYANVVVVYPDHPMASGRPDVGVAVSDLENAQVVLMQSGTTLRSWVNRLLFDGGVTVEVTMELDSVEAIKAMIEARLGISILPMVAVREEVRAGRLVALALRDRQADHEQIAFIHREDKFLTTAMRSLMKLLSEELRRAEDLLTL